jgi:hypothetical protein
LTSQAGEKESWAASNATHRYGSVDLPNNSFWLFGVGFPHLMLPVWRYLVTVGNWIGGRNSFHPREGSPEQWRRRNLSRLISSLKARRLVSGS